MNPAALIALLALGAAGLLAWRNVAAAMTMPQTSLDPAAADPGTIDLGVFSVALPGVDPGQLPTDTTRADRNLAAFLAMIRAAEGTDKDGGYGALFGWPIAGRWFDPLQATGHPKIFFDYTDKAGKKLKTSAAGAYQITYTTWSDYYLPFRAWAALNGYTVTGFSPTTQDNFAIYLLDRDGALQLVRAGRLADAVAIARRRWASLPGAGYDQPERSNNFVIAAYQQAGGTVT